MSGPLLAFALATNTPYIGLCPHLFRLQVNPEEERLARWTTCQLSGMPLQPPCVADELGSLLNKDAVLQVGARALKEVVNWSAFLGYGSLSNKDAVLQVSSCATVVAVLIGGLHTRRADAVVLAREVVFVVVA